MINFIIGFGVIFGIILFLERLVLPRPTRKPLAHRAEFLAIAPVLFFYLTLFMITYRPFLSAMFTLVVYSGIIVANNAKYRVLKEPLVFSDFSLLKQAFKHPALYVRYIGPIKIAAVFFVGFVAIVGGPLVEPPVVLRRGVDSYLPLIIYLSFVVGVIYLITRGRLRRQFQRILYRFGASTDVNEDIDKLSLVVCLIFYFFLSGADSTVSRKYRRRAGDRKLFPGPDPRNRRHLVAVQNESFFDARRMLKHTPDGFLANFDRACREARYYGRMEVPAWGANTLRTEFAFLSGIPNQDLGINRFNPYQNLDHREIWTLASFLKEEGYRTVCIHPYHASFFGRDKVFPNLGFDQFIDIKAFSPDQCVGPYISDAAVADKIDEVLSGSDQPVFIFAITMENHGMWDSERVKPCKEIEAAMPVKSAELAQYLGHLRNADLMIAKIMKTLSDVLESTGRNAAFCFFGDHLPSLPAVFEAAQFDDFRTDYFVWDSFASDSADVQHRETDLTPDRLSNLVVEVLTSELPDS